MHTLQGWKTLSKLTQGLSSCVTTRVTTVSVRQTPARQSSSHRADTKSLRTRYDVVIIGAGHNGLVAAAYLQKAGLDVCVLERRHLVGGCAVTEEIVPGFKFSRASYVLSLFRPEITRDLELKKHGLEVYLRDPYSYTPLLESSPGAGGHVRSLLLQRDPLKNRSQIAQFSHHDAQVFPAYEASLSRMVDAVQPLIDLPPVDVSVWFRRSLRKQWHNWPSLRALIGTVGKFILVRSRETLRNLAWTGQRLGRDIPAFYEFLTAPAVKVLDKWFESEPLKATLATDACIGAMTSPYIAGSGYVLLHHVMGELEGQKGAWGYVKGGMGALSEAIARAARSHGASIFTDKTVSEIAVDAGSARARAVVLNDGTEICGDVILSNVTAKITFLDLLEKSSANLPHDFLQSVAHIDYTSPVGKINVAVNKLPNFLADPNEKGDTPLPHHRGTVHLNCEHTGLIHEAYLDAMQGRCSHRPVIEMTIPSSIDPTLAPPGCHVIQVFVQYVPYTLAGGQQWTDELKEEFADRVFCNIEEYAPGFKASIVGHDILTPPDLERIFGLTGGNIFQGAMSMDQLFFMRPTPFNCDYRTPLPGLYMCGAAAHPGGGVMGAAGRLAALAVLDDRKRK